ncbi:MAG TPA: hypothetical protein VGO47_12960 [Chlamydiales bacterium]|nr:hypothetical protein [Chlamydiales bacterium]
MEHEDTQADSQERLETIPYKDIGITDKNHWSLLEVQTRATTPMIVFFDIVTGTGPTATRGSKVTIMYTGSLLDYTIWGRTCTAEPVSLIFRKPL